MKVRSPSFPFISLPEAMHRARELYNAERRNLVHPDVAVACWGYSPRSSGGKQTIAALRAYGLLEDVRGDLRLTDRAQHILVRESGTAGRSDLLRQAALSPPVFAKLWERYGADLPSDKSLGSYLVLELKFNENAVGDLLRSYRETLAFAELLPGVQEESPPPPEPSRIVMATRQDLTLSFPLGEFRAVRRIRPEEEESFKLLFSLWLEQIKEKPGESS
ncbi:MAG TPA: hypothetical protein VH394_20005 [Thermoanaerobaculia bacterium]|jgi:hypothetical protein|nr:hypothetical protein [Thermoanaerobaculia bacterium]